VQAYNSVKNFFTAGDFSTCINEAMADLAVDLNLIRMFQVLGQGIAVDPETLMKGYLHMKWHLDATLTGSRQKPAGLREEFRGREDLLLLSTPTCATRIANQLHQRHPVPDR
jgi:hypothetical protein